MARIISPEEQIRLVEEQLRRVREMPRFRGQPDVVRDIEEQLALLRQAHRRGALYPLVNRRS